MTTRLLRDGCFLGQESASLAGDNIGQGPARFRWKRVPKPPAHFYTDLCIHEPEKGAQAVGWLIEPPLHSSKLSHYHAALKNREAYRAILTPRADLLRDPLFRFAPFGGAWVKPLDYAPTKQILVSTIASSKRMSQSQRLRHVVIATYRDRLSVWGRGYAPVGSKSLVLAPSAFAIEIENVYGDWWFTEKLIDCFLMRTIPIYRGCPEIGKFFDTEGIFQWQTLDELAAILADISMSRYKDLELFIDENFHRALEYRCAEDWWSAKYPDLLEQP